MDEQKFESLLIKLSWNFTEKEMQNEAISILADNANDMQIKKLIQPISKEYWLNASRVIMQINIDRTKELSTELLVWLKDLNWPGALNILNYFEKNKFEVYKSGYFAAIDLAGKDNDKIWLDNLVELYKRNNLYFILKGIIKYRYRKRAWENGYIRIDLFEERDVTDNICKIYLKIVDYKTMELKFLGDVNFLNNFYSEHLNYDDLHSIEIDLFELDELMELKSAVDMHYSSCLWIRSRLHDSLDELLTQCKKYADLFLNTDKNVND